MADLLAVPVERAPHGDVHASRSRLVRAILAHRGFAAVLIGGLVLRAVLVGLWHGQDFTVLDLASAATLRGVDVYQHHPNYPGGPFAYFPLFLYVEVPLRWAAVHTGVPFVVLGKLPMVAADSAVAVLIYRTVLRIGARPSRAAIAAALFFLNPLVLYNSAFYGRFDSVACALLLAFTVRASRNDFGLRSAGCFALAAVAKTFPVFAIGAACRSAGRRATLLVVTTALVAAAVSLPYLGALGPFVRDIVGYDAGKAPQGLSWWDVLNHVTDPTTATDLSSFGLALFVVGAAVISRRVTDLTTAVAATFVLFLLCSKVVLEQYLIWPLPWLILLGFSGRSPTARASALLVAVYTGLAALDNESIHPDGRNALWVGALLALAGVGYLAVIVASTRSRETHAADDGRRSVDSQLCRDG